MVKTEFLTPPLAANPKCNPSCRVCHYKQLDYPAQLKRKQGWAEDQLAHAWGAVLQRIQPAPLEERLGYRSKSWLRCFFDDGQMSFGMYRSVKIDGHWEKEFISWNTCPLHVQAIQVMIERLRLELSPQLFKENPDYLEQNLVGIWMGSPHLVVVARDPGTRGSFGLSGSPGSPDSPDSPGSPGSPGSPDFFKEVLQRLDWSRILVAPFDRVWLHFNAQVGRHVFGHRAIELIVGEEAIRGASPMGQTHSGLTADHRGGGEGYLGFPQGPQPLAAHWADELLGRPAGEEARVHPIRAFRQNAQTLLVEARAAAVQALLRDKPALVLDLYCGTGDLSLLLPSETGWIGIELSQEAVKYANSLGGVRGELPQRRAGAALQQGSGGGSGSGSGSGSARVHAAFAGAVEQRLRDPQVLNKMGDSYALYLNPPRSGLTEVARERVLAMVCEKRPTAVVYLSCSASSLARDLEAFERVGYRVTRLQPYDFFPQTEHFETLAILGPVQQ